MSTFWIFFFQTEIGTYLSWIYSVYLCGGQVDKLTCCLLCSFCVFFSPRSDEPLMLPLLKAGFDKVRLHTPFTKTAKQLVHLWLVVFCY